MNCDYQNIVEFVVIKNLQFIKCINCGNEFNLFGVYWSLYNTIPLCERMVNIKVDHSYAKYNIEAIIPQEGEYIKKTLEKNNFHELLKRILFDMVLYGNSFIQIIPDDPILRLQRLEPRELQFKIDFIQEPPMRVYFQKIVEIKRFDDPSIEYDINNCLHFKEGLALSEPIGYSICGYWFTTWYFLRNVPHIVPLLDLRGEEYSNLKWFRDFKESSVLGAAGIPHNLIFPWIHPNPRYMSIEQSRFKHDIDRRRNAISRLMERQLFPKILDRDYEYDNFPRLIFHDW